MPTIPLAVVGTGDAATAFRALVDRLAGDLDGREGFQLEVIETVDGTEGTDVVEALGPEPSILVDAADGASRGVGSPALLDAVCRGHAAVTADLAALVGDPADFGVMVADRRLGASAALLPGIPLAAALARAADTGDTVHAVTVLGGSPPQLVDEALVVARLIGLELRHEHVRVVHPPGRPAGWAAHIGQGFPVVAPIEATDGPAPVAGTRAVAVRAGTATAPLTLTGPVRGPELVAGSLLADVLAIAREGDTRWRAHRRRVGATL